MKSLATGLARHLSCDFYAIEPDEDFHFPWTMRGFFRAFPRCILGIYPKIRPLAIQWESYDLVILGVQVWFLSASLPIQGFLASSDARELKGKSVITVMTCRNLWVSASERISASLQALGASHLGQITVGELSPTWATFVTTPRWLLTGKKAGFSIFPPAGIAEAEFAKLEKKGELIGQRWRLSQTVIKTDLDANLNKVSLILMDRIGRQFFEYWGVVFRLLAPRPSLWQDLVLVLFRFSLVALIICLGPCTKVFEWMIGNNPVWSQRLTRSRS